ncbi:MAG: RNA polymerase sigma-70 factor (ECF subfamily) [Pirellulaceae bacterium]|jgi:RNA polymerase sigma-70 factor (ECF subfamily)
MSIWWVEYASLIAWAFCPLPLSCLGVIFMETSFSLLERIREEGSEAAWRRLADLYTPLIRNWLRQRGVTDTDADDLSQDVLMVIARKLPDFEHNQNTGAFRSWLKNITINCLRDFWKKQKIRPTARGGSSFAQILAELEDPHSHCSQQWDREYEIYMTRQLMRMLRPQFSQQTWQAFEQLALRGMSASEVASQLGLTVNSVYIAKSRVLAKLRQEGRGLID